MGEMLNATTVPRAILFGMLLSLICLGAISLASQFDGLGDVTIHNIVLALILGP